METEPFNKDNDYTFVEPLFSDGILLNEFITSSPSQSFGVDEFISDVPTSQDGSDIFFSETPFNEFTIQDPTSNKENHTSFLHIKEEPIVDSNLEIYDKKQKRSRLSQENDPMEKESSIPKHLPLFPPNLIVPAHALSHPSPNKQLNSLYGESPSILLPNQIAFSREELLTLTSEEFEAHVAKITSSRPLTPSEKSAVKRQRRLIKNRESAQASRQRKKDYVGDLEKRVDDLVNGNALLKEQYSSLTTENRYLKNEVEFLTQLVRRVKVY